MKVEGAVQLQGEGVGGHDEKIDDWQATQGGLGAYLEGLLQRHYAGPGLSQTVIMCDTGAEV